MMTDWKERAGAALETVTASAPSPPLARGNSTVSGEVSGNQAVPSVEP
jgi:hypothetical protein